MSSIKWLELTFVQLSPVHIGKYNYGVISETRIFIPGFTMWGALVNAYGLKNGATDSAYEDLKKKFENITCFYPVFNDEIYLPEFHKGQLCYISYPGRIKYTEKQIKALFIDTYISTAVTPDKLAAKKGTLHEIEVFLDRSKFKNGISRDINQVYWRGLVGIYDSRYEEFLSEGLEIIVGGDSRYGLGRLRLESKKEIGEKELGMWQIDKNGYFKSSENPILNYMDAGEVELLKGKIEAVVQLDYRNMIPEAAKNKDDNSFRICFVPGSIVSLKNNVSLKLEKGIYRYIKETCDIKK